MNSHLPLIVLKGADHNVGFNLSKSVIELFPCLLQTLGRPYGNLTDQLPHIKSYLHQEWLQLLAQQRGYEQTMWTCKGEHWSYRCNEIWDFPNSKQREE